MPSGVRAAVAAGRCVACDGELALGPAGYSYRCFGCGLWMSVLDPGPAERLDEPQREAGLEVLRRENFATILDRLDSYRTLVGSSVLDVGCGHGWFLELAGRRGARTVGIEPDTARAEVARGRGTDVRESWFPGGLDKDERFDVICFNDALEHFDDAEAALGACRQHLAPGGLLSINVPDSRGPAFRVAHSLARLGFGSLFDRMWQVGFPSPHLLYFDSFSLERVAHRQGFKLVKAHSLAAVHHRGLWARAALDRRLGRRQLVVLSLGTLALYPLLRWSSPTDILHAVFSSV